MRGSRKVSRENERDKDKESEDKRAEDGQDGTNDSGCALACYSERALQTNNDECSRDAVQNKVDPGKVAGYGKADEEEWIAEQCNNTEQEARPYWPSQEAISHRGDYLALHVIKPAAASFD
jgi:hypothetical protein